jgi:4-amino-4-deoxy-L-arabinose transferase-like glycosyltransferase
VSPSFRKYAWAIPALFFLYFFGLNHVGLLSTDEPRYASIGREMALSGDWITPRLSGEPWFEKPALLYWMTATGFKAGLSEDLAPRLPVALLSVAFLLFFFWIVYSEFGEEPAVYSSLILATSAGWLVYSQVGVTDLPLAATFSAAMLLCLRPGFRRALIAGACLGLAVLAKGLVPLVLAAPLLWRRRIKDLFAIALACVVVAAPWYVLCTMRNGNEFLQEFFVKHHFSRFTSGALMHVQPFWFYVPVLLGLLFPWTPLLVSLFRRDVVADARQLFLVLWVALGFVFFSIASNKLPGYLLPLVPAIAVLMGIRLAVIKNARFYLMSVALLLILIPITGEILPRAMLVGLSKVRSTTGLYWLPLGVVLALGIRRLEAQGSRRAAITLLGTVILLGVVYFKISVYPRLDSTASARYIWRRIQGVRDQTCVGDISRSWVYGLNFYSVTPLPPCSSGTFRVQLIPGEAGRPIIVYR